MTNIENNNIYLGDAYELIKHVKDKTIDLIITDPPYVIESVTGGGMLKEKRLVDSMQNLKDKGLDVGIKEEIYDEFLRVLKKPNLYIWCNKGMIPSILNYFVIKKGFTFEIICWHKTNAIPLCGGKYLSDTEYCVYIKEGVKLNTTYDTAKTYYNLPINMKDKELYDHPTIKPIEIIKNFIINSSNENDVVLDTFIGSGTTAVASKELNRQYIGFELNPEYLKICLDRIDGISQKDRRIEDTGQLSIFDI